jgi:hypothetical protein
MKAIKRYKKDVTRDNMRQHVSVFYENDMIRISTLN